MASYLVYGDSAADMPSHIYQEHDIRIIPMDYMLNGESHHFFTSDPDHDKICEELYEAEKVGADVSTTQITPYNYIEIWTPDLEAGNDILYICFSSGMSATYENAVNAANQLKEDFPERKIEVVDSLSGTAGQGLMTYLAALNRDEKNMTIEENAEAMRNASKYICHRFIVGDLNYLHKGGRVSRTAAVVGTMLNVRPGIIIDDEGKLQVVSKTRGTKAAINKIVEASVRQWGVEGLPEIIFCNYCANVDELPYFKEQLEKAFGTDKRIEFVRLGPILGVHVGPSILSVCTWGKAKKD